jgi:1,4-dihydroxy-2-naphthoate octaprenyltransferase
VELFINFIRLARPLFLLGGVLLYALGGGIYRYLGGTLDGSVYWLGQALVTCLQLAAQFLNEYFNYEGDLANPNRTPLTGGSGQLGPGKLPARTARGAAQLLLAGVAVLTAALILQRALNPTAAFILILAVLGGVFYSTPPLRLEGSGYGELTTSILVATLLPAFAYSLQTGELHRLLALTTLGLTLLHLAMLIAFSLPDYATDLKFGKRTLLVRLGWANGMQLHNALIAAGYLALAVPLLFDVPLALVLPGLLTLPLGALQIWLMQRIAAGDKPNWTLLTVTALATFAVTAYLLTFAYWTH